MAPRILIFSIAMGADNSFYVKFIATFAPTFFRYIISVLAIVYTVTVSAHFFADTVEISLTVLPIQCAPTWQWNYSRIHTEHHGELQCHQIGC